MRAQTTIPQKHRETGKGHLPHVEKNMPSIIGVLGTIDRLYQPGIAAALFGPASHIPEERTEAIRREHEMRSAEQCDDRVNIKLHQPHCVGERPVDEFQRKILAAKAAALQDQLQHLDRNIQRRSEDAVLLSNLRNIHISKKKSGIRHLLSTRKLSQQPLEVDCALTHELAEDTANRNVVTCSRSVPVFAAGAGIPGQEGYSKRSHSASVLAEANRSMIRDMVHAATPQPATSIASAAEGSAPLKAVSLRDDVPEFGRRWAKAVTTPKDELNRMNETMIPMEMCRSQMKPPCLRIFPQHRSSEAPFATHPSERIPKRAIAHANMSTPVQWLKAEVKDTVEGFNRTIVFTPNVRRDPVLRKATIPLPASTSEMAATIRAQTAAIVSMRSKAPQYVSSSAAASDSVKAASEGSQS